MIPGEPATAHYCGGGMWLRMVVMTVAVWSSASVPAHADGRDDVRRQVAAGGYPELADRAARAARPMVAVNRTRLRRAPKTRGTSRFGGVPDLPAGEPWPQCAGRPQSFLGQIRLRDLPPTAIELRRLGGVLLLFTQVQLENPSDTGYGLHAGRCTAVIHAPPGARLVRARKPAIPTFDTLLARMRFGARLDLPGFGRGDRLSPPLDDVRIADGEWRRWAGIRGRVQRLPGHLEHKLLGYVDGANDELDACWSSTQRRRTTPWQHLIAVGQDPVIGFEVADGGRLQVAIHPADLRRGRFDRVCGIFNE